MGQQKAEQDKGSRVTRPRRAPPLGALSSRDGSRLKLWYKVFETRGDPDKATSRKLSERPFNTKRTAFCEKRPPSSQRFQYSV